MDPAAVSAAPAPPGPPTASIEVDQADTAPAKIGIGDVIHAEHRRVLRLFDALDDVARRGESPLGRSALRQVWLRLADLVEHHTDAEEHICFPALLGRGGNVMALLEDAIADHNDIRAAVAEARFLETGSARWWRAVAAARDECAEHFRREERDLVTALCDFLTHEATRTALRQWETFAVGRVEPDRCQRLWTARAEIRGPVGPSVIR